jgi:hypothetical protein
VTFPSTSVPNLSLSLIKIFLIRITFCKNSLYFYFLIKSKVIHVFLYFFSFFIKFGMINANKKFRKILKFNYD